MQPIKPKHTPGCVTSSSNCVLWQGPDLPCIDLCTGDSITVAVYNMAQLLCSSAAGVVDLTSLDFKCLVDQYQTAPDTLTKLLQALIDKVCSLDELLEELGEAGGTSGDGGTGGEPLLRLPKCLQYIEQETQDEVLSLPHSTYSVLLAGQICGLLTDLSTVKKGQVALTKRVTRIEEDLRELGIGDELTVPIKCLLEEPADLALPKAFELLEEVVCGLKAAVGTQADVVAAISRQCVGLSEAPLLSNRRTTFAELPAWVSLPATLADAVGNLWLALCDVRLEVIRLSGIIRASCSDVLLDFEFVPALTGRQGVLRLFGSAIIPANFRSESTSRLVISDDNPAHTLTVPVDVDLLARSSVAYVDVLLSTTELDITQRLKFELIADLVDDEGVKCSHTRTRLIRPLCSPLPVALSDVRITPTYSGASIAWLAPVAPAAPVRYRVQVLPVAVATPEDEVSAAPVAPVFTAETTSRAVTVPDNELTSATDYQVRIVAVYDCAESPELTLPMTTLTCLSTQGTLSFTRNVTETGSSVAYVEVNDDMITDPTTTPLVIATGCDGKVLINYGVSASINIELEEGRLFVNGVQQGITVRVQDGIYESTVTLAVTPGEPLDIEFRVTSTESAY